MSQPDYLPPGGMDLDNCKACGHREFVYLKTGLCEECTKLGRTPK